VPATLADLERDPHAEFARLRQREPVAWIEDLGAWVVLRRDLALTAMRDSARFTVDDPRFTTARVIGPMMLSVDGAEHDRHRAPFARPFRKAPVNERFADTVANETDALIDAFAADGSAEIKAQFAGPLATAITLDALGIADAGTDNVLRWYRQIVASVEGLASGKQATAEGEAAYAALSHAIGEVIDAGGDSLLVAASGDADALTKDQLVSNAAVMLFGGIETTEGMIANAVRHLLLHPVALAAIRADATLLPNAIEESLRLEPAAATIDRYATSDTELGGAAIKQGDMVTVSIASANRDPATFPDPDTFDIRRENARLHVAFAHGPHVCIGMHLARLEAHTAVGRLLDRLPGMTLRPRCTSPGNAHNTCGEPEKDHGAESPPWTHRQLRDSAHRGSCRARCSRRRKR
jgi:cytochrome P450